MNGPCGEHAGGDPWKGLRRFTAARIALGRTGSSLPTRELLDFQLAHARAMDAVHAALEPDRLATAIGVLGLDTLVLSTCARDRKTYLTRPDLGRRFSDDSRKRLEDAARGVRPPDVALLVVDGLSALAAHRQVVPLLQRLIPMLDSAGIRVGPVILVPHGRVALQDEAGTVLGAKVALSLIGERPGLGSPDSLGAYFVYGPRPGNTDANRNCVSNIRPEGLHPDCAAETLFYLIRESLRRQVSGVELKDDRDQVLSRPATPEHLE